MKEAVIRRWFCACVLSVVGTGCFTDVPAGGPMMIGQTEGGECREGSAECRCYGNDTCDPGLMCIAGADVCVPDGCVPGSDGCVCDDGFACDPGLECEGSVCGPGQGSTATSTNPSGTSTSSTSNTDDDDSTTESASTEPETSVSTTVEDGSSSTTEDPMECGGLECAVCSTCVTDEGQSCSDEWDACESTPGCLAVASCMRECSVNQLCGDNCCEGVDGAVSDLAVALHTCRGDTCTGAGACTDWDSPPCF